MNTKTITEYIKDELQNKKVTHAIFTTYNFEPEFFETEVIPLLFQDEKYYSNHPTIKRYQVKQELEKSNISIELFYDKDIFSSEDTPQMEYLHQGINHPYGAFHPKIIYVLFENENGQTSLLLYAGSNNLTKAGWWDNLETGNYILIDSKHSISEFTLENIKKSLSYFKKEKKFNSPKQSGIVAIEKFIKSVKTAKNNSTYFYFQRYKNYTCYDFFEDYPFPMRNKITNLEIVSPFFSDDDKSNLHKKYFPNFKINLFLPKNQQDKALCTEEYYKYCDADVSVTWSKFNTDVEKKLGIDQKDDKQQYRKLHAKIFHFYNQENSWFFTGSFNFTHKAFHDNIEAGFLYKANTKTEALLENAPNEVYFEEELDDIDNPISSEEEKIDINILFDWDKKILKIELSDCENIEKLILRDNELSELQVIYVDDNSIKVEHVNMVLLEYMEKNSYIYIDKQSVLIQHINWQYKPVLFEQMSISEILSIYSTLSNSDQIEERYIAHLFRELEKQGALYESSIHDIDVEERNFFSEYSEIFYSFRKLKAILVEAVKNGEDKLLEYYFRMQYPDSFTSIVKRLSDEKNESSTTLDITTKYLVLLSLEELYEDIQIYMSDEVYKQLEKLKEETKQCIYDQDAKQRVFLEWFEKEFKMKHNSIGNSNA